MKTLPKNIMTPEALDMCENFDGTFKDYGDVFAIDSDMDGVCLSYTGDGIDVINLTGMTLGEAISKLPSFGIRALYWKDTDHRMQWGLKGAMWTEGYLSDLPTAWSVVDEMCDTPVWDCVVTGFYYDMETGWFCIIIDKPTVDDTFDSFPEDDETMDNTYNVRTSSTNDTYITTYRNGLEYICYSDGGIDSLLSYADEERSRIVGKNLSLDKAQQILSSIPYADFLEELCENTHAF